MKRVLTLLLSICLVLGVSATAFAVDDMCTIRVFSGVQGAIDGGSVKSYQVKRGDSFSQITAIDGYAVCPKGSKYYPIHRWLVKNGLEDSNYIVVDDCASNLKQEFGERFLQVKGKNGLSAVHVKRAIQLLGLKENTK